MKIVLLGDSIFDNATYVDVNQSVTDILSKNRGLNIHLLAVDGDVTTDVEKQLKQFPKKNTLTFVSCGGNDALQSVAILEKQASTVNDALAILTDRIEAFRKNYRDMLQKILKKTNKLIVCSIYNQVPDLPKSSKTALALFNEVVLEEALKLHLSLIDLRLVCAERSDYSKVSSIEPSFEGGIKIAKRIERVIYNHNFDEKIQIYT